MQNRTLILSLIAVFLLATFALISVNQKLAQAQVPFGGRILFKMPTTTQPPPNTAIICPPHTVVSSTRGQVFGLVGGRLYNYGNTFSGWALGKYTPFTLPNCVGAIGVFWPVYPLLFMGTSAY